MTAETDLLPDPAAPVSRTGPRAWRERAGAWIESLDLSPARLAAGAAVLVVLGLAAWKLLAPAPVPAEMTLPMASAADAGSGGSGEVREGGAGGGTPGPAGADSGAPGGPAGSAPTTAPADAEVVVHVAGAVNDPGVRRLPAAARLDDAVDAAGGATGRADLARVNLAAAVEDGQQVYVPEVGETGSGGAGAPAAGPGGARGDAAAEGGSGAPGALIDVNTAAATELQELPGIGPTISQAIVDHRQEHGAFPSVESLIDVRGIGEVTLDALRDLVAV